jgi:hypothetical protein
LGAQSDLRWTTAAIELAFGGQTRGLNLLKLTVAD